MTSSDTNDCLWPLMTAKLKQKSKRGGEGTLREEHFYCGFPKSQFFLKPIILFFVCVRYRYGRISIFFLVCTVQLKENVRYVRYFFSENVQYCTVFLLGVYGTMYGICVKPPWPPWSNDFSEKKRDLKSVVHCPFKLRSFGVISGHCWSLEVTMSPNILFFAFLYCLGY